LRRGDQALSNRASRAAWLTAGACLLGIVLRVAALGRAPLWFDEAMYYWLAREPLSLELFSGRGLLAEPLFVAAFHEWVKLGDSEFWLRLHAAVAGALCIPVAVVLGRSLSGPFGGAGAGYWVALAPLMVYYSRDAKMYAWIALFYLMAVAATIVYARGRAPKRALAVYAVAALALCYTHFAAPLYLAATGSGACLLLLRQPRRFALWCVVNAAVAAMALPFILAEINFSESMAGRVFHASPPQLMDLWISLRVQTAGYTVRPVLAVMIAVLTLLLASSLLFRATARKYAIFGLYCALFPLCALWLVSLLAPWSVYIDRYASGSAGVLAALAGAALGGYLSPRPRLLISVIALAAAAPLLADMYAMQLPDDPRDRKGVVPRMDARAIAEILARESEPGDTLAHLSWETEPVMRYYAPGMRHAILQDGTTTEKAMLALVTQRFIDLYRWRPIDYRAAFEERGRWWLLIPEDPILQNTATAVLSALESRGTLVAGHASGRPFEQTRLLAFDLDQPPPIGIHPRLSATMIVEAGTLEARLEREAESGIVHLTIVNQTDLPQVITYTATGSAFEIPASQMQNEGTGWSQRNYLAAGGVRDAAYARTQIDAPAHGTLVQTIPLQGNYDVFVERVVEGPLQTLPCAPLQLLIGGEALLVPGAAPAGAPGGWTWVYAGQHEFRATEEFRVASAGTDGRAEAFAVVSRVVFQQAAAAAAIIKPYLGGMTVPPAASNTQQIDLSPEADWISVAGSAGSAPFYLLLPINQD